MRRPPLPSPGMRPSTRAHRMAAAAAPIRIDRTIQPSTVIVATPRLIGPPLADRYGTNGVLAGDASGGVSAAAEGGGATAADWVSDADRSPDENEDGGDSDDGDALEKLDEPLISDDDENSDDEDEDEELEDESELDDEDPVMTAPSMWGGAKEAW